MTPLALPERSLSSLDCVHTCDALALLRGLGDGSIDMILTSPPYDNLRKYNGFTWDFERIAQQSYRVLKPGGVLVWVVGDATVDGSETLTSMRQALYFVDSVGFKLWDTMIWQKNKGSSPNTATNPTRYQPCFEYMFVFSKGRPATVNLLTEPSRYAGEKKQSSQRQRNGENKDYSGPYIIANNSPMGNVWYMPVGWMHTTADIAAYDHPAMFPEELARRHISTWSNPGDVVLDYFAGSGTTLKMARALNRHYIGGDLSAEYVRIARERLATPFTLPLPFPVEAPAVATQAALPW